jgi:hypothetical protein
VENPVPGCGNRSRLIHFYYDNAFERCSNSSNPVVLPLRKLPRMKFPAPIAVQKIADLIGAKLAGNVNGLVTGINEIHKVEPGDLVFVDHPKYYDKCIHSAATFIIINKETSFPEGKALLIVDQPLKHTKPSSVISVLFNLP